MSIESEYYEATATFNEIGEKKDRVYDQILKLQKRVCRSEKENNRLAQLWDEYNELAEQHVWAARCIDDIEAEWY